ncbi:MAG: MBL fold metallo-hydrolase [Bacteroidaceae bacterium]|jgi:phosphoribosyl 1,2-cyclic phosphodiesterase
MKIKFQSFASGSSGNCYYLGTEQEGILIDAGIGSRTIKKNLREIGLELENIKGILVTHDHADHIKSIPVLGNKYFIPIYTTELIYGGINRNKCIHEELSASSVRYISKEKPFQLAGFRITAFPIPHDATESVGYFIESPLGNFCFLTDMGCITPKAESYIDQTSYLILEANYDQEMLQMGPYPAYLKKRIASETGHMSNQDTIDYLARTLSARLQQETGNATTPLVHVWLCHLSRENNHPQLLEKDLELGLRKNALEIGRDIEVTVLKRTTPSNLYEISQSSKPACP